MPTLIERGQPIVLLADATVGAATGATFALPNPVFSNAISVQSVIAPTPSAVSVVIELSMDGTAWYTIATLSNTAGEIQTGSIFSYGFLFIRARKASQTGAGTVTISVSISVGTGVIG